MLSTKKLLYKIVNVLNGFEVRSVSITPTVPASGYYNTNLKTLIDADLPAGKKFLAISGFTSNSVQVVFNSVRCNDTNYALQVRNLSSTAQSNSITVWYLCGYVGS